MTTIIDSWIPTVVGARSLQIAQDVEREDAVGFGVLNLSTLASFLGGFAINMPPSQSPEIEE